MMQDVTSSRAKSGETAVTVAASAGIAGVDSLIACGVATAVGAAGVAIVTAGAVFGVAFATSMFALSLGRAAGRADDLAAELEDEDLYEEYLEA